MDVMSSLLNIAMGRVEGVLLPGPQGACALLPKVTRQLTELESIQNINDQVFPGSITRLENNERFKWMTKILKSHPISQIVWPGTHNSATNKTGLPFITRPFGQHQTLSIHHQLRNGVRFLDIRVQQDRRVCNGNFLSYHIDVVIEEIKSFMDETDSEIIILELRTERGYTDPPNFESYLEEKLGDLLIYQDDSVFSKTIFEVLPKKIICIWRPNNSPMPRLGGPIWNASYLRDDTFETELPLTKFQANLYNLKQQIPACERNFFYRVENTLTPQISNSLELLLMWPKHVDVVSKRINGFARLFLTKCQSEDILDRMQIYSSDFIETDFITACIGLNYAREVRNLEAVPKKPEAMVLIESERYTQMMLKLKSAEDDKEQLKMVQKYRQDLELKVKNLEVQLETTNINFNEDKQQAVLCEQNKATEIQRELEELKKEFEDAKVNMTTKNSFLTENETFMGEFGDAREKLENMQKQFQELEKLRSTTEGRDTTTTCDNENIFLVFAKDLLMEGHSGWKWSYLTETPSHDVIEVVDVLQVSWLKVDGIFHVEKLVKGIQYEVAFVVMLKNSDHGWEKPVNLLLSLPDGTRQRNEECLNHRPREKWIEISAGSFMMSSNMNGNIKFTLEEREPEQKKGLVIKGVVIQKKDRIDIVFASFLGISSYENPQCWRWACLYEGNNELAEVQVAELLKVSRLHVHGKFDIPSLLPGYTYQVAYIIMLKKSAYGWEAPVKLSLLLPNGDKVEREESFEKKPREEWITIPVGDFKKTARISGHVEFSLSNFDVQPKSGLVVKSVVIQRVFS